MEKKPSESGFLQFKSKNDAASAAAEGGSVDFLSKDAVAIHEKETRLRLRRQRELNKVRDAEESLQAAVIRLLQRQKGEVALLSLREVSSYLLSEHAETTASALLVLKRSLPEVLDKCSRLFVGGRKSCLKRNSRLELLRRLQQKSSCAPACEDDGWEEVAVRKSDAPLGAENSSRRTDSATSCQCQFKEGEGEQDQEKVEEEEDEEDEEEDDDEELFVLLQRLSPAEVAVSNRALQRRVCKFLDFKDVLNFALVCRATADLATDEGIWLPMLKRHFPKATLTDPDFRVKKEKEQRDCREARMQLLDAVRVRFPPDIPFSFLDALELAQSAWRGKRRGPTEGADETKKLIVTPEDLAETLSLSSHENDGAYLLKQNPEKWSEMVFGGFASSFSHFVPFNPYSLPPPGSSEERILVKQILSRMQTEESLSLYIPSSATAGTRELHSSEEEKEFSLMTASQTFRLWRTGLLQPESLSKTPWIHFTSNSGSGLRSVSAISVPIGDLLDLAEKHVFAVRESDPLSAHRMALRTLFAAVNKNTVEKCASRRVALLLHALKQKRLLIDADARKHLERRLNALMGEVKEERSFGLFFCRGCGSRWKSGFAYPKVRQNCERCGRWVLPFSLLPLLKAPPCVLKEIQTEHLEHRLSRLKMDEEGRSTGSLKGRGGRRRTHRLQTSLDDWQRRERKRQEELAAALEARMKSTGRGLGEELQNKDAEKGNPLSGKQEDASRFITTRHIESFKAKGADDHRRGVQRRKSEDLQNAKSNMEIRHRLVSTLLASQGLAPKTPNRQRREPSKNA